MCTHISYLYIYIYIYLKKIYIYLFKIYIYIFLYIYIYLYIYAYEYMNMFMNLDPPNNLNKWSKYSWFWGKTQGCKRRVRENAWSGMFWILLVALATTAWVNGIRISKRGNIVRRGWHTSITYCTPRTSRNWQGVPTSLSIPDYLVLGVLLPLFVT